MAGLHRHAPAIGEGLRVAGRIEGLERDVGDRMHAGHVHQHADQIGQAQGVGQFGADEVGLVDEAVGQRRAFENVGDAAQLAVGAGAGAHLGEAVAGHWRRNALRRVEKQAGGHFGDAGAGVQVEFGAQGEALGGHRVDGDEIFGEVAVGFEGGAHAGEHDVLLGQGVVGVHEINGDAVQAAQADFLVMGVGRRAAVELARQPVGVERRRGERGDPGVFDAFEVDQQLAPVEGGERRAGQHVAGAVELPADGGAGVGRGGEQVGERQRGPVAEFGLGPGDEFEGGDARVVDVVVGPGLAGEAAQVFEAFGKEGGGVLADGLGRA